jgi:pyridoxine 5-phosphate synthase
VTRLSVNINKLATLRNARGGDNPNLQQATIDIESFGSQGITVHPRPDERHIRYRDVREIRSLVKTEFNIEGYPNKKFIDLVLEVKPDQVTLVPDGPDVLTSNAGWKVSDNKEYLKDIVAVFKESNIRTSLFMDANLDEIDALKDVGCDRIELYTEDYAQKYDFDKDQAIKPYIAAAKLGSNMGLGINAGHDLDLKNLRYFHENIPNLDEVSIGHALICDALYFGLENTVNLYLRELR